MKKTILIAIVIASCIVGSSVYLIFSSDANIRDKTLFVATYFADGENYQITDEFIAIFTDHSIYKIGYDTNTNDSYDSNSIIFQGDNNRLSKHEIRDLIYIFNNTIPNTTCYSDNGYILYLSRKALLSNQEYNALTTLIENSDFSMLNETYKLESSEIISGGVWSWIAINNNSHIKKVVCYGNNPTSYREIWDMVEILESEKWEEN